LTPRKRKSLFKKLAESNPVPRTDLVFETPFELLIAVILSAQATDVGVNKATRILFPVARTPETVHALGVAGLSGYVRSIGLWNSKAKNIIATCRILIDEHGSVVPGTREALEALPGVGRKTANVVLNVAFGQATMAVDTHVFRVSNRTGLARGKTPLAVEKCLEANVPAPYRMKAHHWLILQGRYVCKALKPECWRCPIHDECEYDEKVLEPGGRVRLRL